MYDDRKTGQGIGIRLFYNLVSSKYLNIARVDVQNFLRKQGDYSITRPYNKTKYNKPVLAKKSNERWGLDTMKMARYSVFTNEEDSDKPFQKNLEKMNRGGKMTNILTVIDYFSKKCGQEEWKVALARNCTGICKYITRSEDHSSCAPS